MAEPSGIIHGQSEFRVSYAFLPAAVKKVYPDIEATQILCICDDEVGELRLTVDAEPVH